MTTEYFLTPEGKRQLTAELSYLKNEKQKEINEEIKKHHSFCDFSDNASFDQMLDEQALLQKRINILEDQLAYGKTIPPKKTSEKSIQVGDTVYFKELPAGVEEHYTIVSAPEADLAQNKISLGSPVGQALLNRKIDEVVTIKIPTGEMQVCILGIK